MRRKPYGIGKLIMETADRGLPMTNVRNFACTTRDELLNLEVFDTLLEAKVLVERWRIEYNTFRPHSSLGYRPPAPEATAPRLPRKAG